MMRYSRSDRISIDLDSFNQFELLKTYYNMKNMFENVLVKKTLHGYHVMAYCEKRTPELNLHVRTMLNDCRNRLELDYWRLVHDESDLIETLFSKKIMDGVVGIEEDFNIDSKPFWGNTKLRINRR